MSKVRNSFNKKPPFQGKKPPLRERSAFERAAAEGNNAVIRLFISEYPDWFVRQRDLLTLMLMEAAMYNQAATVELLLDNGADPGARRDGWTALIRAANNDHTETGRLLVARGAAVDQKSSASKTALMHAAEQGHIAFVDMLLEVGAEINAYADNNGNTALMYAAIKGQMDMVRHLLEKGADAEKTTKWGLTARLFAARAGHKAVAEMLGEWCQRQQDEKERLFAEQLALRTNFKAGLNRPMRRPKLIKL
jgi:ankyrin repeat protein